MVSRRRAWWVDACVVSFACWLLQGVSVDYSARFFHHAALSGDASLVHAHAGLRRVVETPLGDGLGAVVRWRFGGWGASNATFPLRHPGLDPGSR